VKMHLHNGKADSTHTMDLQAESHWGHLCPGHCEKCKQCNPENNVSVDKVYYILKDIIGPWTFPLPEHNASEPSATAASSRRRKSKEPSAPAASSKTKETPKEPSEPPSPEELRKGSIDNLVDVATELQTVEVINKLLAVFKPGSKCVLKCPGGPKVNDILKRELQALSVDCDLEYSVIEKMYLGPKGRSRSRSPRGSGQPERSPSEEHHSDEEVPFRGRAQNKRRDDIPERCDWGGPERGDDRDVHFLKEDRTEMTQADRRQIWGIPKAESPISPILSTEDSRMARTAATRQLHRGTCWNGGRRKGTRRSEQKSSCRGFYRKRKKSYQAPRSSGQEERQAERSSHFLERIRERKTSTKRCA
jgi:hypothetical protein